LLAPSIPTAVAWELPEISMLMAKNVGKSYKGKSPQFLVGGFFSGHGVVILPIPKLLLL
tara:strand:- start:250 stop:426 length:177 start_codon:yes stop_codon:yes gene_type:complete